MLLNNPGMSDMHVCIRQPIFLTQNSNWDGPFSIQMELMTHGRTLLWFQRIAKEESLETSKQASPMFYHWVDSKFFHTWHVLWCLLAAETHFSMLENSWVVAHFVPLLILSPSWQAFRSTNLATGARKRILVFLVFPSHQSNVGACLSKLLQAWWFWRQTTTGW